MAIPALVATFALYLKAVNTPGGSMLWAALSAIAYGYMVLAWGGHIFVVNLIAVHCLAMIFCGRFTGRLYVVYSGWFVCAGLLAVQTPFVRGKIMGGSSEYIVAQCAFVLVQIRAVVPMLHSALCKSYLRPVGSLVAVGVLLLVPIVVMIRVTSFRDWADGRLRRLLDPTRAATSLVASVAEHQTARWSSLFKDLHLLQVLFPAGLILLAHGDCVEHCIGNDNDDDSGSDSGNGSNSQRDNGHQNHRRQGRVCDEMNGTSRNSTHGRAPSDAKIFVALFGCVALYFNGIMERCSLIFAPVACVVSGIAASRAVGIYASKSLRACRRCAPKIACCGVDRIRIAHKDETSDSSALVKSIVVVEGKAITSNSEQRPVPVEFATGLGSTCVVLSLLGLTCAFMQHAVWMAAVEFSSPSVIFAKPDSLSSSVGDTDAYVDDFREAYMWLRLNTPEDAKVLAWWDYGYQIAALANRTTFIDGNTWNSTAIATVGRVLVSSEVEGARLMRQMGADFVLIVFGGVVGWPNDDIGKMLWPIRIASEAFPEAVREKDFLSGGAGGRLRMDPGATRAVKESLLVKCAYHRFEQHQHHSRGRGGVDASNHGYDCARMSYGPFADATTGNRGGGSSTRTQSQQQLRELREVYSTTNWVVRIFAVNREPNRS